MLCMKMFVNFHMFWTLVYLHIVFFLLSSIVKCFEFLKALYKFPISFIIIIIMYKWGYMVYYNLKSCNKTLL